MRNPGVIYQGEKQRRTRSGRRQRSNTSQAIQGIHDNNNIIKYKFYNGQSRKPLQAHEIRTNAITDKDIQTTITLSISQIQRRTRSCILERSGDGILGRNRYEIHMLQGGPPHKPYFIAIDNKDQVIIGPSKKIVATHVVGELKVLF